MPQIISFHIAEIYIKELEEKLAKAQKRIKELEEERKNRIAF